MKKLTKQTKKRLFLSGIGLFVVLIAFGTGIFVLKKQEQKAFEDKTSAVQKKGLAEWKRKTAKQSKKESTGQEHSMNVKYPNQEVDYSGKDVRPLSEKDLETVDVPTTISQFGAGEIRIPAIGMNLPVLEGISQNNLSVGAGTGKANQESGKGNFVLLGHYMTNSGLLFGGIKNLKQGAAIVLTYQGKTVQYTVTEAKTISAYESYVMEDSEGDGFITLLTCTGTGHTDERFMVRGHLT